IVQVIKTFWELGHEHKFITEIVARRVNDCIVSITEPDSKNLNKNDIEDIVYREFSDMGNSARFPTWNRKLSTEDNLTAPTITFLGIEEYDVLSILYEQVSGKGDETFRDTQVL
ncbi:hypothetical protein Tco_0069233, partial [Tanacetum coccineum]